MRDKLYSALSSFHFFFKKRYAKRLRVLAYHTVPDKMAFEKQVIYLKSQYNIISIEDLKSHFRENQPLPKNPLLITFDDGDITVLQKGLPVLKQHNLSSCLFIITGLINTSKDVWIKRIEAKEMKEGKTYLQAREVVKQFKEISNVERVGRMEEYLEVSKPQLTTQDLKEMIQSGMFIANHTHTHPMLDKCTPEEISEELTEAKKVFETLQFPGFDVFAYPNGNADEQTTEVLKKFNMELVFLFDHKINKKNMDPLNISRIMVDSDTEMTEFKAKVSGAHPFLFHLRK
ncbi:polysaccharide deacetylase family protein [Salegentibacter sp. F188]|uniref:Polysaccharide deacetylase family protein n=1 Tax=Autumnicola patrickiae TaxID=3075591 RepID=A0ABU3E1I7_9FLAO|nr:polysaccharide deacetylase family protein [Salegentibacter sp. F188]MDT0689821.1 polysaccharide deacetylase family protein [Salegentibacter sp. F188]